MNPGSGREIPCTPESEVSMKLDEKITRTRSNGDTQEFVLRLCRPEDLEDILALQTLVKKSLGGYGEIFVEDTREELAESLELDCCIGVWADGRLVAFSLSIANRISDRNLARKLDISDADLSDYVTYDTTFVHPDFRGFGLQQYFMPIKDRDARERGASYALCTVSPDNPHSLYNIQATGFQVVRRCTMYGGVERFILEKPVRQGG
jgi:GNAT superfamily N-acetyltransferase